MVGLVEPGTTSEVWIAPQISAKRKAMARGEDHIESLPPKLQPIPEPKTTSLDVLRQAYGDRLRLAVEPDAIFAAITGSHIRVSLEVQFWLFENSNSCSVFKNEPNGLLCSSNCNSRERCWRHSG
jgi:hypothetical protein